MSSEVHLTQNKDMKATFEHQTRAPTELINNNTVTLNYLALLLCYSREIFQFLQ